MSSGIRSRPFASAPALDFADVYRELAPTVTRWVRRLGAPPAEVEDTVHDIFLVVQRLLPEFRGDSRLGTWVFAITRRAVRKRRRRDRLRRLLLRRRAADELVELGAVPTPIQELERARDRALLRAVLDRMSERLRTVFVLYELEGRSGEEIAELTATQVATVWVQLHRARKQFQRRLEEVEACRRSAR